MRVEIVTLWLQKSGNEVEDYEDAYSVGESSDLPSSNFRCAVADGATESSFASLWAKLLTSGYVREKPLAESRSSFQCQIDSKELSWFAEAKADLGAFAALVGLTLLADGSWTAQATGDSCLFHIRAGRALKIFPLVNSEEFDHAPLLICSKHSDRGDVPNHIADHWLPSDFFFLATDSLSRWLMVNLERENNGAIASLLELKNNLDFESFAQAERKKIESNGRPILHNDDLTLMRIKVE